MLLFFNFLTIFLYFVKAEWEIPEEFHPPKELFERIGGYASWLRFAETPLHQIQNAVQVFLSTSLETKYSSIVIPNEAQSQLTVNDCLLPFSSAKECYRLSETKKIQRFERVMKEDECEFVNSTFLQLNVPNIQGYCNIENNFHPKFGSNITAFCKRLCSSQPDNLQFLSRQLPTNQFCNCGKCATIPNPSLPAKLSNHLQVNIALQSSTFSATINFTDVNAINSQSDSIRRIGNNDDCLSIVSTSVDYFIIDNSTANTARFWLKRGRFHCPSEITCPWEIFYVFYQDDPFFQPSYLFSAKVVILGIHVAIAEKAITFYTNKLW